jgi:hypothetical protein
MRALSRFSRAGLIAAFIENIPNTSVTSMMIFW